MNGMVPTELQNGGKMEYPKNGQSITPIVNIFYFRIRYKLLTI